MNFIDYLSCNYDGNIIVWCTSTPKNRNLSVYQNTSPKVKIRRMRFSESHLFFRMIDYGFFYLKGLNLLFHSKANTVLYFESISAWPALMLKRIKGKRIKVMVHYHEYMDPHDRTQETFLSKWLHHMEKKMYHCFSSISHTNEVRLQMFKDDNDLNNLPASLFRFIPNYPPGSWLKEQKNHCINEKVKKLVFVGSLGYDSMYLQEVMDWLSIHEKEFALDIYSYNIDEKAKQALQNQSLNNIRFCGGADYAALPSILKKYDVGLVIYKPFSQNTIHAVSNKVFEYLACGLDVWFSEDMTYTLNYSRNNVYPKIIPVNFKQLHSFDYISALSRENLTYQASSFFYENVYSELLNCIKKDE